MTRMKQVGVLCIVALVSFSVGKFLTPTKTEIKEVEKVVYKEKSDSERDSSKEKKRKETIKPDGTRIIEETEKSKNKSKKSTDKSLDKETSKEIKTENRKDWQVMVMYAPSEQSFGLSVQRRIISEIYIGVYGTQDKTFGISLGVGF